MGGGEDDVGGAGGGGAESLFPDDDSNQILPVEQFFGNLEAMQVRLMAIIHQISPGFETGSVQDSWDLVAF